MIAQSFVGRRRELASLSRRLESVTRDRQGKAVTIRGRRQVGKSRLVDQFCRDAGCPYVYFQASRGVSPTESLGEFLAAIRESSLPAAADLPAQPPGGWLDGFKLLSLVLPDASPSIVVVDELPWLLQQDSHLEGPLQTAWDRHLSTKPMLLILIGSDLHMMAAFTGYDRPFYGRSDQLVIHPLNPADTATMTTLAAPDALDAYLITGGFPGLCRAWPPETAPRDFLAAQCEDPASPLFAAGESMVNSEFPNPDQTRRVLEAIGHGERTFTNIARAASASPGDPVKGGTLGPVLQRLQDKHAVTADAPLATTPGNGGKLYRVSDPYLRLYLAVLARAHEDVKRDRPELALRRIQRQWESWRGRAIEPVVREALSRAADALPWPDAEAVGGWWPRGFDPEIDVIGADRAPVARTVFYAGSIKWLDSAFDRRDHAALVRDSARVPGVAPGETGLVAVSRSGVEPGLPLDLVWGPDDVLAAWR
ncbi:MAG TPA: ATP-binding protein [Micromonosporaceae bacterium]